MVLTSSGYWLVVYIQGQEDWLSYYFLDVFNLGFVTMYILSSVKRAVKSPQIPPIPGLEKDRRWARGGGIGSYDYEAAVLEVQL